MKGLNDRLYKAQQTERDRLTALTDSGYIQKANEYRLKEASEFISLCPKDDKCDYYYPGTWKRQCRKFHPRHLMDAINTRNQEAMDVLAAEQYWIRMEAEATYGTQSETRGRVLRMVLCTFGSPHQETLSR